MTTHFLMHLAFATASGWAILAPWMPDRFTIKAWENSKVTF